MDMRTFLKWQLFFEERNKADEKGDSLSIDLNSPDAEALLLKAAY